MPSIGFPSFVAEARPSFRLMLTVAALAATLALVFPLDSVGQEAQWKSYTSLREVTALSGSSTHVWVGTTGGVYSQAREGGETRRYGIAEGMNGLNVTAIAYDDACEAEGCVWVGYQNGVLDRIDLESEAVSGLRDIERAQRYPSRKINRIVVVGDSLLVATDFGVVVVDKGRSEVIDTYDQFGTFEVATPAYDALLAPLPDGGTHVWIATAKGLAYAPLRAANLQDPASWTTEVAGLPSFDVRSIGYFEGRLYAGTALGLARREDDGHFERLPLPGEPVTQLISTPEMLIGVDPYDFLLVTADGLVTRTRPQGYEGLRGLSPGPAGGIWFGSRDAGLVPGRIDAGSPDVTILRDCLAVDARCYPESPYNNQFRSLDVATDGSVWAAGVFGAGTGFHRLDTEGGWTDYVNRLTPDLNGDSFTRIYVASDGNIWAASEGGGLAQVGPDGQITRYGWRNSSLRTPEGEANQEYIFVGGIAETADGGIWATTRGAAHSLNYRAPDGTWTGIDFPNGCGGFTAFTGTFREIYVDKQDQIWLSITDKANFARRRGLMVIDPGATPDDLGDDECRVFRNETGRGEGLPSDSVNAIVEDLDGLVWVATDQGIAYTLNTGVVAADEQATFTWPIQTDQEEGRYLLQGLKVNDLAVDPANRLWAATDNGLWLIQRRDDGFEEAAHFTTANSPILSDEVFSVTVHPMTGEVFVATGQGLLSYQGAALVAAESVTDLFVFPNPVLAAEGDPEIHIQNLVDATEVMIMAVDGTLVTRFAARGGQALWNGQDSAGKPVPSGVYLIVVVGRNGEGTAYGKVAVVR